MELNIYLGFPGTAREALEFYKSVLGGEMLMVMTWGEAPPEHCPSDPALKDQIMHAGLKIGNMIIMASDQPEQYYQTPQGFHISLNVTDEAEAERVFTALSEGGKVTMPLDATFWAKKFGMFTDRFDIGWMVNCE